MANFLVVDDHPLAVVAIRMLLENSGHKVIAETGDAYKVLSLIEKHGPDALVLDIDLPGKDGIQILKSMRDKKIMLPVIIMNGKNADYYAMQSMRYGANGYISKNSHLDNLNYAIHAVLSGYSYFPQRTSECVPTISTATDSDKIRALSSREFQVLRYLAAGTEIIDIAEHLGISHKTVSTYKARLMDKLGLRNQKDMLDFTRRNEIS
ncbi:DNA-binding response regulator [Enterobacterales bacterium CwR94]|nr:DNA-binding response regulator [Enterobacterales bacterium CwR94]